MKTQIVPFLVISALALSLSSPKAAGLDDWALRNPFPTENDMRNVAYGNGTYVLVGLGISVSTNLANWVSFQLPASDVVFGNGIFVAAGYGNLTYTSLDGFSWTSHVTVPGTTFGPFSGMTYGQGLFVAVGSMAIITSTDGTNWIRQAYDGPYGPLDVHYANGLFVAVGYGGAIYTSPDAAHWTFRQGGLDYTLYGVTYGKGLYVAVGSNNKDLALTSADGVSWTSQTLPLTPLTNAVGWASGIVFAEDRFVVASATGIVTSTNGLDWISSPNPGGLAGVGYGNEGFLAVGPGRIDRSADGQNWSSISHGTRVQLLGLASSPNTCVAVGDGGIILTSTNGSTWTQRNTGATARLNGIAWGNGTFVAIGNDPLLIGQIQRPTVLTSTNSETWQPQTIPDFTNRVYSIAYGQGLFVLIARGSEPQTIMISPDGIQWQPATVHSRSWLPFKKVRFVHGRFYAFTDQNYLYVSNEGLIWDEAYVPPETGLADVAYGNGFYLGLESYRNYPSSFVATSADGDTWTNTYTNSGYAPLLAYGGGQFVMVSQGWSKSSTNGVDWVNSLWNRRLNDLIYFKDTFIGVADQGVILQSGPVPSASGRLRINGIRQQGNPQILLQIQAPDTSFQLESSEDFKQWTPVIPTVNSGDTIEFLEPNSAAPAQRFFRAVGQLP